MIQRLVEIILNIKNNKLIKNSMGKNSRLLAEKKFDKEILCEKFYKVINKVLLLN